MNERDNMALRRDNRTLMFALRDKAAEFPVSALYNREVHLQRGIEPIVDGRDVIQTQDGVHCVTGDRARHGMTLCLPRSMSGLPASCCAALVHGARSMGKTCSAYRLLTMAL
jgi:hypothetical protein